MDLVGRWWNGAYGRLVRRDLWLWTDGHSWRVCARKGTADSPTWTHDYALEWEARALIDGMIKRTTEKYGDRWRDITKLVTKP